MSRLTSPCTNLANQIKERYENTKDESGDKAVTKGDCEPSLLARIMRRVAGPSNPFIGHDFAPPEKQRDNGKE